MDWIDPPSATVSDQDSAVSGRAAKSKKRRSKNKSKKGDAKPLAAYLSTALAKPIEAWSAEFGQSLAGLRWPAGCSLESTFLWSAVIQEQAEVLGRVGVPPQKLFDLFGADLFEPELGWAALDEADSLDRDHSLESTAFRWLEFSSEDASSALGLAGLAWHIPQHAGRPGNVWLTQWLQLVCDQMAIYEPADDASILCPLVMQCELPLLIGLTATEAAGLAAKETNRVEVGRAMDFLAEYLEGSDDNPAPWLVHGATYLRAALASVLRCRLLADRLGLAKWYLPQRKALAGLLKHAARWSRPDGTALLGAGKKVPRAKSIWSALAAEAKKSPSLTAAMTLSGIGEGKRSEVRKTVKPFKLPALTCYSEAASGACMQSDWREKGCHIAVDFSDSNICIEALGPKGEPVLAGDWLAHVERDGQAELQLGGWEAVCWFSDDDVDYLELEAQFGQAARLQRQAVLLREERMLFLADALLADDDATWAIQSSLPLALGCEFKPAKKTTEGFLRTSTGARCLTLPLFLPEWRRQLSMLTTPISLGASGEELIARAESTAGQMFMAICIQLEDANPKQQFTWRALTVGEDLRIVKPHEAVAYRVQIGLQQLVIYRSLTPATRRTALGLHTMADFYVGRFDADEGEVDTIVEVEACKPA